MKKILTCSLLLGSLLIAAFSDVDPVKAIIDRVKRFNSSYPDENIYLHTDKTIYRPGETVWFSIYCLNGVTHHPSDISDVAHVELIGPKGTVIEEPQFLLQDGTGSGDFKLSSDYPGGMYKLRAWTNWSRNFPGQKVFEKEFQVQQVITPRLLLKFDWERKAYGPGDSAEAKLTIRNLKDEKVTAAVRFLVEIAGNRVFEDNISSDSEGVARLRFQIPEGITTIDGLLQALVSTNGIDESISRSIPIVLNRLHLDFFPEGGDLVSNLESRVAFKAINEFGKGADIAGYVLEDGIRVATFESFHKGMGQFVLRPLAGKQYSVRLTKPAGISEIFALPVIQPDGYVLSASEYDGSIAVSINSTDAKQAKAHLVVSNHGEPFYDAELNIVDGRAKHVITPDKLKTSSGIVVITLFDEKGNPRCERLIYPQNGRKMNIHVDANKDRYEPRESVKLKIKTTDEKGKPVSARVSLAVVDDQLISFADDRQDNILSWFNLSTEVKGHVEEPSFYFDPSEANAPQALDFLLMTQGWRRFEWKAVPTSLKIEHAAEKEGTITGKLLMKHPQERNNFVMLVEMANDNRAISVRPREDGTFAFVGTDPSVPLLLMTKKPNQLQVDQRQTKVLKAASQPGVQAHKSLGRIEDFNGQANTDDEEGNMNSNQSMKADMDMGADVTSLSEVVVVGYSVQQKALASSITEVQVNRAVAGSIESALQGRVAGVTVTSPAGDQSARQSVTIQGVNSLAEGRAEPLYVIDGVVLSGLQSTNLPSMLSPNNIEMVTIVPSLKATALYGSRASNGAIVVTTSSSIPRRWYVANRRKERYMYQIIEPRLFSPVRQFYIPRKQNGEERSDFRTTVYWQQHIVTDKNGDATISYENNDSRSVFRVTTEGVSTDGRIGRTETTYSTQMPFSVDLKIPEFIGFEDTVRIPVRIINETNDLLNTTVDVAANDGITVLGGSNTIKAVPHQATSFTLTLTSKYKSGRFPLEISIKSGRHSDVVRKSILVQQVGFPVRQQVSSVDSIGFMSLDLREAEKGSLKATFQAFPGFVGTAMSDVSQLLREPYGCFEQVSSTTFPNILVLQYMKKTGLADKALESKALKLIESGYRKLMAYEIRGGGFEWFGSPPAHEALSAYGLVEFYEMSKVYAGVDARVLDRTAQWLMERKDGKGGFKQNRGKYGFSGAPAAVNNAYIVYALAVTGHSGMEREYQTSLEEALDSKDLYRVSLVALAAHALGKRPDYDRLIRLMLSEVDRVGINNVKAENSIVWSGGQSLQNETLGFCIQALAKAGSAHIWELNQYVTYLMQHKMRPGFGSTQTTVVCLQALSAIAELSQSAPAEGTIRLELDSLPLDSVEYSRASANIIELSGFGNKIMSDGGRQLGVSFSNKPLPWQLELEWYSKRPADCQVCDLDLTTDLKPTVRINETTRLTATVRNRRETALPMTMVVIGIPAGLSAQTWQLKEQQEKGAFDFYEIQGDRIAIYFREMGPGAAQQIILDLKAEVPGRYTGAANCTYLYYTSDCKKWTPGLPVTVTTQ